jgi:hypothetical protein
MDWGVFIAVNIVLALIVFLLIKAMDALSS